jgi:hypothetical protein
MTGSRAGGLRALAAMAAGVPALAAMLALTACGAGGGVLSSERESPAPGFTQTIAPRPATTTPTPAPPAGTRVRFGRIVLTLPAGWRLGPRTDGTTCAMAPGQTTCLGGALTIRILPLRPRDRVDWPAAVLNDPAGWLGSSPTVCYAPGAIDPDHADVARGRVTARSNVPLSGGERAVYRQWEVPCTSGKSFTVRLWWIPAKRVVFYTLGANPSYGPAYDQIVGSADLKGYRPRGVTSAPAAPTAG